LSEIYIVNGIPRRLSPKKAANLAARGKSVSGFDAKGKPEKPKSKSKAVKGPVADKAVKGPSSDKSKGKSSTKGKGK